MTHKRRALLAAGAALLLAAHGLALDAPPARAANLTVNTTADELNDDGDCSLREAITAANTNTAVDACPAGSGVATDFITFSVSGTVTIFDTALPAISGDLDINGSGQSITISGDNFFRIFYVNPDGTLAVRNLTLTNGYAYASNGGCIFNAGLLVTDNVVVQNCYAGWDGGGVFNDADGLMGLYSSTFQKNRAYYDCGGICDFGAYVDISSSTIFSNTAETHSAGGFGTAGSEVHLSNSSVISNTAALDGGGLYNNVYMGLSNVTVISNTAGSQGGGLFNNSIGTLDVTNTTFQSNTALGGGSIYDGGGGLYNGGAATVSGTQFVGNTGTVRGGGVKNTGTATISDSLASSNTANEGGGIYTESVLTITTSTVISNAALYSGGGLENNANTNTLTLSVYATTINGNTATWGGGIWSSGQTLVVNSTLSGNSAYGGGGVENYSQAITFYNSTLARNSATAYGGGLNIQWGVYATLYNTIIADSLSGGDCLQAFSPPFFVVDGGNNLVEDNSCGFTGGSDPRLGPLADNGGPTWTHMLLPTSPAINAGNNAICAAPPVGGVDQRGVARPIGVACDIGAVEALVPRAYFPIVRRP